MFRKISAKDSNFNQMKHKHTIFFQSYENFVENTELGYSRGVAKNSGKAHSYKNYLIRLFIFVEEFSKIEIVAPASIDAFQLIENIKNYSGYKEYNKSENRFPNAVLNYYLSFVSQILMDQETEIDNLSDQLIDFKQNNIKNSDIFIEKVINNPEKRPAPVIVNNIKRYKRNLLEVRKAKDSANYTCEFDNNHVTFQNSYDNKPFIEAHHLIPMATQGLFEYNIDFADNIICLCPNCHRRIHYGVKSDKIEMVQKFYKVRKGKIEYFNVDVKYNNLELFYNIK
ncbi:HNH endonuclease [Macrococcus sp. CCM 2573]